VGANPYAKYQQTQIETADQEKLLLMLYDGALRFLGRARKALLETDLEGSNNNLIRVQDIIAELMASLDLETGEVAVSLFQLYEYMHFLLVQANIKKSTEPLEQVEGMLVELRNTWKKALGVEQETVTDNKPADSTPAKGSIAPLPDQENTVDKIGSLAGYDKGGREESTLRKGYKGVNISG
jgi:flagellar protein FliS